MQALPHLYDVQVNTTATSQVIASSNGIPDLITAGPAEFGGPGDQWSPETLLMSAVASCFVLSFKAVASASKFPWKDLQCNATGKLDKVERTMKFTEITTKVRLVISDQNNSEKAIKLIEKSESICLVTNSLSSQLKLEYDIVVES